MDNQIYERDYTRKRDISSSDARERETLLKYSISSGLLKTMSESFNQLPREINNEKKAAYERILAALDTIAEVLGGQIKGIIDFQNWEAHIYAYLPFSEFSSLEELDLLKDIAVNAQTVTFTATPDGGIRLSVLIAYFDVIGDIEETLAEEIAQYPELVASLEQSQQAEME